VKLFCKIKYFIARNTTRQNRLAWRFEICYIHLVVRPRLLRYITHSRTDTRANRHAASRRRATYVAPCNVH